MVMPCDSSMLENPSSTISSIIFSPSVWRWLFQQDEKASMVRSETVCVPGDLRSEVGSDQNNRSRQSLDEEYRHRESDESSESLRGCLKNRGWGRLVPTHGRDVHAP